MKKLGILLLMLLISGVLEAAPAQKVFGSSPPMNYLIYAINPDKMVGLNFSAKNANNDTDAKLIKPSFLKLPIIGSFHGSGGGINVETILKHKPDLIFVWEDDYLNTKVSQAIAKTKIPTLTIAFRKVESMPDSIQKAADAMGEHERGKALASFALKTLHDVKTLTSPLKKARYYYAEGNDGLATECDDSFHVEALNFAGGENVHKCAQSNLQGLERITFEQLILYDPDVIIVQNAMVQKAMQNNPLWQHLRAFKNKRVHLAPNSPFHWLDRPPSFMRIIGIEWLSSKFHPEVYRGDLHQKIAAFYRLFLGVELTNKEIKKILGEK